MKLRADEISSLIQKQIEGFEAGVELKETGRVISVGDGIARIYGLENAMSGELLSFPNDLVGMVLNLEEDNIGSILLGFDNHVKEGDEVKRTGKVMQVPYFDRTHGGTIPSFRSSALREYGGSGRHCEAYENERGVRSSWPAEHPDIDGASRGADDN